MSSVYNKGNCKLEPESFVDIEEQQTPLQSTTPNVNEERSDSPKSARENGSSALNNAFLDGCWENFNWPICAKLGITSVSLARKCTLLTLTLFVIGGSATLYIITLNFGPPTTRLATKSDYSPSTAELLTPGKDKDMRGQEEIQNEGRVNHRQKFMISLQKAQNTFEQTPFKRKTPMVDPNDPTNDDLSCNSVNSDLERLNFTSDTLVDPFEMDWSLHSFPIKNLSMLEGTIIKNLKIIPVKVSSSPTTASFFKMLGHFPNLQNLTVYDREDWCIPPGNDSLDDASKLVWNNLKFLKIVDMNDKDDCKEGMSIGKWILSKVSMPRIQSLDFICCGLEGKDDFSFVHDFLVEHKETLEKVRVSNCTIPAL